MKTSFVNLMLVSLIVLISINFVFAQPIIVTKSAPPRISFGDNLAVTINIENNGNSNLEADVFEIVYGDPVYPQEVIQIQPPEGIIAMSPPYYEWHLTLKPGDNKITYIIKPRNLGILTIGSTSVSVGNEYYESNLVSVVVRCNNEGVCDSEIGENFANCKEDCPSGGRDDYCDMEADDIADPDCPAGEDILSSFIKDSCHNGMLDYGEDGIDCGETCSNPCDNKICEPCVIFDGTGFRALYCNNDNKCQYRENFNPDCEDCVQMLQAKCGDNICSIGEHASCDKDCKNLRCGDGICQSEENVLNCKEDCKPRCGDSIISEGEVCDTKASKNPTCQDEGFASGRATCKSREKCLPLAGCECDTSSGNCKKSVCNNPVASSCSYNYNCFQPFQNCKCLYPDCPNVNCEVKSGRRTIIQQVPSDQCQFTNRVCVPPRTGCSCQNADCLTSICSSKVASNCIERCELDTSSCLSCGNNVCEASDGGFLSCSQDCRLPDADSDSKIDDREILLFLTKVNNLNLVERKNAIEWWFSS